MKIWKLCLLSFLVDATRAFVTTKDALLVPSYNKRQQQQHNNHFRLYMAAPTLNGKMVLPMKVMSNGLQGQDNVAAVYALLNMEYKRGNPGWQHVVKIGTTLDLSSTLSSNDDRLDNVKIGHVRALSFTFPQPDVMREIAEEWITNVADAGGELLIEDIQTTTLGGLNHDDFDDDEDEWELDDLDMMPSLPLKPAPAPAITTATDSSCCDDPGCDDNSVEEDVVSPFAASEDKNKNDITTNNNGELAFTVESINKVLDEIRPYLISDGGNVSIDSIDEEKRDVYLKLEGACGSCPSSTVTMQMGIERVLRENFDPLGQVLQVQPTTIELTGEPLEERVMTELSRIGPAISGMGGQYEVSKIDVDVGQVVLKFKGPNRLQQGLELALLDISEVRHVKFTMMD
mmetsp:Transcript_36883/g.42069  ORF Transcript_36883/g.42069 Transcript_36883/m.42069 type:complete len:401 (+) Transcript_36883:57-1259(+)